MKNQLCFSVLCRRIISSIRNGALMALACLAAGSATARPFFALGTSGRLEGAAAGMDSVVLVANGPWTATNNVPWLHLAVTNQSGASSTNVVFSYDDNTNITRTGTLTIAGFTLTVTQAGSNYVKTPWMATPLVSSGLNNPYGVAVDGSGNVYIADTGNNAIKEWSASSNTVTTLVFGLHNPEGVAVDASGNVYFSDSGSNAIKEWTVANSNVVTLVSNGLSNPFGVALDSSGNVYIADAGNNAIKKWSVASSNVTALVTSGLSDPVGVALDAVGNVYITDYNNQAIKEWSVANDTVATLVSGAVVDYPYGVAVDGAGNVFFNSGINYVIDEWVAASNTVVTLVANGLNFPYGVAVDGAGDLYVADTYDNAIKKAPYAFVNPAPISTSSAGGGNALPVILPSTESLLPPFAPASDQTWVTFPGTTDGVVSVAISPNTGTPRTALITLLDQSIQVIQSGISGPGLLGTMTRLEGPAAGMDSVVLSSFDDAWTATANATWLHLSAPSGTGSTNVIFSYDANTGATRTGTLSIASQTLTITQAGSTYVSVTGPVTPLVTNGLDIPTGVAVDGAGNVYISDTAHNSFKEWTAANNSVTTLVSSGLNYPHGAATDDAGNVYFADEGNNAVKEWVVANSNLITAPISGLESPSGVAVDGAGNLYIADEGNNAVKEWTAANGNLTDLVLSGLDNPYGMAVDGAGNVYFSDQGDSVIKELILANNTVTTLPIPGLGNPGGVAMDGAGNIYIADNDNNAIKEWMAASNTVTTLVAGLYAPFAVTLDEAGNVYFADTFNNAIKELPIAFVDPTTRMESYTAGADTLPVVLPATENLRAPFAPSSDQSWLTITGITNGAVSFSFTATTTGRTANITLLGQTIPIVQPTPPPLIQLLNSGPANAVDFGVLPVGSSASNTFVITNFGGMTLNVSNITYPFPGVFSLSWSNGPIAPGNSQQVTLTFAPVDPANYSGTVTVVSDAGNNSNTLAVTAFGANTNLLLTILTNGLGSVTPNDAKFIRLGTKVSLKAVPDKTNVFVNWTGSTNSTGNPLKFTMASNTIVQANFIPNPYLPFLGTYNGLFWAGNGVTESNAGMLKGLTLTSTGHYSATLLLDGKSKPISGTFNPFGQTSNSVAVAGNEGTVELAMTLVSNVPAPQIVGTVSNAAWIATNLTADRATNNSQLSSAYTLLVQSDANASASPLGDGYALISGTRGTTRTPASARITGWLADGTAFSESTFVSADGYAPVYANLYSGKGLLVGWINLDPTNASGASVAWVHPVRTGLFAAAFISTNQIALSPWSNSPATTLLPTNLVFIATTDNQPVDTNAFTIAISNNYKLGKVTGSDKLSGSVAPKTGLVTVTIGSGPSKVTGTGVILLNATNGGGYFLTRTNAGSVTLGQ